MKSAKKDKTVTDKNATKTSKEKALKEVFLEESTKVRLKINTIEQSIKELQDGVYKIKSRLGL